VLPTTICPSRSAVSGSMRLNDGAQPFSQKFRTAIVRKVFQIGLCEVVEAHVELFCNSAGFLGERLYITVCCNLSRYSITVRAILSVTSSTFELHFLQANHRDAAREWCCRLAVVSLPGSVTRPAAGRCLQSRRAPPHWLPLACAGPARAAAAAPPHRKRLCPALPPPVLGGCGRPSAPGART